MHAHTWQATHTLWRMLSSVFTPIFGWPHLGRVLRVVRGSPGQQLRAGLSIRPAIGQRPKVDGPDDDAVAVVQRRQLACSSRG